MSLAEVLASVQKSFDFRKEVTIGGIPFELSILTLQEEQKLGALSDEGKDAMQYVADLRRHLLSYAIKKVKNEVIPEVVKSTVDGKEITEERAIYVKRFIDNMPGDLVEALFDVYVDLKDESDQKLRGSLKYSWFKTPEQREAEAKKRAEEIEKKTEEDITLKPISKTEESEEPKT